MKVAIRRIGNSFGVILPKSLLEIWGVSEGGYLQLSERGSRPASSVHTHEMLDKLKRNLAVEVASRFAPNLIRAHSLGNLHRWKKSGVWGPVYREWQDLLSRSDDGELFAVMLGRDDHANQLRQSPPYVGLLPREVVKKLNEEAAG